MFHKIAVFGIKLRIISRVQKHVKQRYVEMKGKTGFFNTSNAHLRYFKQP